MNIHFLVLLIIILISFMLFFQSDITGFQNYIAPFGSKTQKNWWKRDNWMKFGYPAYSYWENFENESDTKKNTSILDYPPNNPGPANLYNNQPYHLLSDQFSQPRMEESLSCVNSRSCYATDFERMVSKTGNYRQLTNNYKRNYPDSCSSPFQELVLNFYKADKMDIPTNNTGKSVSEL
jgi:hypothetical protein